MHILLTAFILFIVMPAHAGSDIFEKVRDNQRINCGFALWNPGNILDPNTGEQSGMVYDIVEEIGQKLNYEIVWKEETGFGTIIEGLNQRRYDMACAGVFINTGRAQAATFSDPLFYAPVIAVVRADETEIDSFEDLNQPSSKIAIIDGEAGSFLAQKRFPNATKSALPRMSELSAILMHVAHKKADAAIIDTGTFYKFDQANPGLLKQLGTQPVSANPVALALPLGEFELRDLINVALGELQFEGTIDRIISEYELFPGMFYPVTKPYEVPQ